MQEGALHLLGGGEEALARAGQPGARRPPVEQARPERRLERRDAAADGGVVEPQPFGGADELAGAGDGEEDPDIVPVHRRFSLFLHGGCAKSTIAVQESLSA